jgi:Uma2 family endonuclease
MDPAQRLATYEDLKALPSDVRAEVLAGTVQTLPAALPEHVRAQRVLGRFIGGPFDDDDGRGGPGGWWILLEVDVRLDRHNVVRPDLVGWRRSRLPEPWGKRPIDVVPDWVCEIVSPSNEAHDRVRKASLYAEHGVRHYWIVDPEERMLEALVLHDGSWMISGRYERSAVARIEPFEAVELELERLFPPESSEP